MKKTISRLVKISVFLLSGIANIFSWLIKPLWFLEVKVQKCSDKIKALDPLDPMNILKKELKTRRDQIQQILSAPPEPDGHGGWVDQKIPFHKFKPNKEPKTKVEYVYVMVNGATGEPMSTSQQAHSPVIGSVPPGVLKRVELSEDTEENEN